MTMSKSKSRALEDLMKAVDAGHVIDGTTSSSDNNNNKLLLAPRRSSYGRFSRQTVVSKKAPPPPPAASSDDASFEFSAAVSYSSASPASMVFSDGQLRAHQFPAVRSSSAASSQVVSPVRNSSAVGNTGRSSSRTLGTNKKRVSFATDRAAATKVGAAGQGKKSGGLMGCMGSACGSSCNEVVDPAKNVNRKVVAV